MKPQEIYLLGLVGLRALAEYDPPEYRRATDMSKRELERQIEFMLENTDSSEGRVLYEDVKTIIDTTESPMELSFLLKQIYLSSFRKAQYYSLQTSRQKSAERFQEASFDYGEARHMSEQRTGVSREDELVRLSAMLLLRHLPEYSPTFNQHFKNIDIDCVLEPQLPEMPYMVMEAKSKIVNRKQLETSIKQLKSVMSAFGRNTVGIIATEHMQVEFNREILGKNIHILLFDVRKNRFIGEELYGLMKHIR